MYNKSKALLTTPFMQISSSPSTNPRMSEQFRIEIESGKLLALSISGSKEPIFTPSMMHSYNYDKSIFNSDILQGKTNLDDYFFYKLHAPKHSLSLFEIDELTADIYIKDAIPLLMQINKNDTNGNSTDKITIFELRMTRHWRRDPPFLPKIMDFEEQNIDLTIEVKGVLFDSPKCLNALQRFLVNESLPGLLFAFYVFKFFFNR